MTLRDYLLDPMFEIRVPGSLKRPTVVRRAMSCRVVFVRVVDHVSEGEIDLRYTVRVLSLP